MINIGKTLAVVSAALIAPLLSACSADSLALSDREAAPAAQSRGRLQERPAFPVDERQRPFAQLADRDQRTATGDTPSSQEEAKPAQ